MDTEAQSYAEFARNIPVVFNHLLCALVATHFRFCT